MFTYLELNGKAVAVPARHKLGLTALQEARQCMSPQSQEGMVRVLFCVEIAPLYALALVDINSGTPRCPSYHAGARLLSQAAVTACSMPVRPQQVIALWRSAL